MLRQPEVIGIASGKGGVGKTSLSVNIAREMAQKGKKVFLFDGDMGLANAQIALGIKAENNISHVISGEKNINDIVVEISPGFSLIPGASGVDQMAALSEIETAGIVNVFSDLRSELDFLIIDLAAGISPSVLTLFEACHRRLVVVVDEPSSIADAYGLIKVSYQRSSREDIFLLQNRFVAEDGERLQDSLFNLLNQVCVKFLSKSLRNLGNISEDEFFRLAMRERKALMDYAPSSLAAKDIKLVVEKILSENVVHDTDGGLEFFVDRKS
jgi:flagellar biosynthesis protein FlhG